MSGIGNDKLSGILAAAAHPARRRLLALLGREPSRVTDLAARFEISLAAVSRHIRVLEEAGLVERTVEGREHLIAVRSGSLAPVQSWAEVQTRLWNERLHRLKKMMEE
jgi:DNA-binding transcriptional ArsR family regulator